MLPRLFRFVFRFTLARSNIVCLQNLLHGVAAVGILSLIAKLHKWDESAMFFDGSSLGMPFCIAWLFEN